MTHFLEKERFLAVVNDTPLVAIDLVVIDTDGKVLVGRRKNSPAKGFWFAPGGRICKGETLDDAFARVSMSELGMALSRKQAKLLGIYEHIYSDNFAEIEGIGTHYVVVAYKIDIGYTGAPLPQEQHSDYAWMSPDELVHNSQVHHNTKVYVF